MAEMTNRQTILIVDDVPANIKILGESLKTEYRIRMAVSGAKAIEIAMSSTPPDLILLDIVMPDMDGLEVCRKLKAAKRSRNIPIIFITGKSEEADETKGLELGAVDYITKPFSLPIVQARIRTHMELKRHRDLLENLSTLDGLTGIPNRRRFDEFIKREWMKAVREPVLLSLIFIDIDFFKAFNDTYGHGAGDECLKNVAKTLQNTAKRPMDFVARYGGEEFVCVLPGTDLDGAMRVATCMRESIENLNIPHSKSIVSDNISVSLGVVTTLPKKKSSPDAFIESADKALYQAKRQGRNRIVNIDLTVRENDMEGTEENQGG